MNLTITKSVNFGPLKTGLNTIGFTLLNPNGSVSQARSTSGITELSAGTGIYGGLLNLPVGGSLVILWDTGDSNIYYAADNYDSRSYQGSGGGVAFMAKPVKDESPWTKTEKKRIAANLKKMMEAIIVSHEKTDALSESFIKTMTSLREGELKFLVNKKIDFDVIENAIKDLSESVSNLNKKDIDFSQVTKKIEDVQKLVKESHVVMQPIVDGLTTLIENQTNLEPLLDGVSALIESEHLKRITT